MTNPTADRLLKSAIDAATEELNAAIVKAAEAGLLVYIGQYERLEIANSRPVPVVYATVSRPV